MFIKAYDTLQIFKKYHIRLFKHDFLCNYNVYKGILFQMVGEVNICNEIMLIFV